MNQVSNRKNQLTSLLLLVFLFFSMIGHAHTIDVTKSGIEQQDCNLCQHHLDKVPQKIKLAPVDIGKFSEIVVQSFVINSNPSYFLLPQLRAPPAIF